MTKVAAPAARPREAVHAILSAIAAPSDFARVDALSVAIFSDKLLQRRVRTMEKLDLAAIRLQIEGFLRNPRHATRRGAEPIETHKLLVAGLKGEALVLSSALLLDTISETEGFFHLSSKTIKSKLGHTLAPGPSELALRMVRATLTAMEVFGDLESARRYLRTRNFALGGAMPKDLLQTAEGERIVLNELQTQAEGGPL